MDDRFERFMRERLRNLGKQYERTRQAYTEGKDDADSASASEQAIEIPVDEAGRAKLVCRRHAEKRAVELDSAAKPACFDPDHTDCVGCVEDIRDGLIETW